MVFNDEMQLRESQQRIDDLKNELYLDFEQAIW